MSKNRRYLRFLSHTFSWFGGQAPLVLIVLLIIVAATWGFIEVAAEVASGDTQAFPGLHQQLPQRSLDGISRGFPDVGIATDNNHEKVSRESLLSDRCGDHDDYCRR